MFVQTPLNLCFLLLSSDITFQTTKCFSGLILQWAGYWRGFTVVIICQKEFSNLHVVLRGLFSWSWKFLYTERFK